MTITLKHTPLHAAHVRLGARMVPFAGYDMPVQYAGIIAESRAVRTSAGIFDVSHMGRFTLEGPDARALLDWVHTADIGESMDTGRSRYGLFCNEAGGIIDDGIIYRRGADRFLVVANAANAATVFAWLERWRAARFPRVTLTDVTPAIAMLALQGPQAVPLLAGVSDFNASPVRAFRIGEVGVQGRVMLCARTGYTGEDGVELMPAAEDAAWLWDLLLAQGVAPCGLGSRDTLRLEAALPLHGHDIDETTNPIEAGLARFVHLGKADFCGAAAVRHVALAGPSRLLTGFQTAERGALPRAGCPILAQGAVIGSVTSGGYAPSLDRNIGLGYVPARFSAPGTGLQIDVRGRLLDAATVPLPFYSRDTRKVPPV